MLFLRTFGGLSLESDGEPIGGAASRRRPLAVLAVLAVAGDASVSRDRLYALFWPESDLERARGALKQALYSVRRDVSAQDLTIGSSDLRLNREVIQSDAAEFTRLVSAGDLEGAVALYGGPFLDGIHLKDAAEFERWVERERDRLAHAHRGALERLAKSAEEAGDVTRAVAWWRAAAASDPLSARLAGAYMRALASAGDREAAIRHGASYADLARSEIGADPDPGIIALAEELRTSRAPAVQERRHSKVEELAVLPSNTPTRTGEDRSSDVAGRSRRWYSSPRVYAAAAAVTVAAIAAATAWANRPRFDPKLVLVAPFESATSDTLTRSVAAIATERLREAIAQTGVAQVVDYQPFSNRAGVSSGDDQWERAKAHARRTGASTIVRGTIRRSLDTLTLHAQLMSAADGKLVIATTPIVGVVTDPGAAVETVRQRIMGAFAGLADDRYRDWVRALTTPPRYDAYQEYVAGLESVNRMAPRPPQEGINHARIAFTHFLNAARLDTVFVQAKIWAAQSDNGSAGPNLRDSLLDAASAQREGLTEYDRASLDHALAQRARDREGMLLSARRMSAAAPWDVQAVIAHGASAVLTNHYEEAIRALRRIDPARQRLFGEGAYFSWLMRANHMRGDFVAELADGQRLGQVVSARVGMCSGRALRPLSALGRVRSVDSLVPICVQIPGGVGRGVLYLNAGMEYHLHGHGEAARRAFGIAREWYQSLQPPREDGIALIDWFTGDCGGVESFWRSHMPKGGSELARAYGQLGVCATRLGASARADSLLRKLEAMDRSSGPADGTTLRSILSRVMILTARGEEVAAIHLFRQAVDRGLSAVTLHFEMPDFERGLEPLRRNPEFQAPFRPLR